MFFPETEIWGLKQKKEKNRDMGSVGGSVYVEEEKRSVGGGREGDKVVRVAFFNREKKKRVRSRRALTFEEYFKLHERSKNIIK